MATAMKLKELGYHNFEIIEGSGRVGGRLYHLTMGAYTVEMGPIVVHTAPDNPVMALLHKYNVSVQESSYDDWIVRDKNGTDVTELADTIYGERWQPAVVRMTNETKRAVSEHRPDFTLESAFHKAGWIPNSFIDNVIEYFEIDWLYGYGPEETSGQFSFFDKVVEHNEEFGEFFVKNDRGYSIIVQNLLDEVLGNDTSRLHLNNVVTHIEEKGEKVVINTDDNETYTGDFAVVTFSLGVLQSQSVRFEPELPEWKTDAILQFQMAQYTTVHIQFNTTFWDDHEWFCMLMTQKCSILYLT